MADKIKLVDRGLPSAQRYVTFQSSELTSGDVIQVTESLGRAAEKLRIEVVQGSDLRIRLNTQLNVYPDRKYPSHNCFSWAEYGLPLLASGVQLDSGTGYIDVGKSTAAVSYLMDDMPITDLQVTFSTASGVFHLTLS